MAVGSVEHKEPFMNTKLGYLALATVILFAFRAKADDIAWGSTNVGNLVHVNITTGLLVPFPGTTVTSFAVVDRSGKNLGGSNLTLTSVGSVLYGLDNTGNIYTIDTTRLVG